MQKLNWGSFLTIVLSITCLIIGISSCQGPKQLYYLQGLNDTTFKNASSYIEPVVHIGDQLYIFVSSSNTEASAVYNLPNFSVASANMSAGQTQNNPVSGYLVDNNGQVTMPKIGSITVAGLTYNQIKSKIGTQLSEYLKDPIVSVRLLNYRVTVLGEVNHPGTYSIPFADINVLQALGLAGDLTINGVRKSILLIRQSDTERQTFHLDLTDKELIHHPAYIIQSGDVIYVQPNKTKMNTSSTFFQIWPATVSAATLLILVLKYFSL